MQEEKSLDLAGIACPMNFVRIKIALSQLPPGAVIRVRLDGGAVADNVKRTLVEQNYEVLSMEQEGEFAIIFVKKV